MNHRLFLAALTVFALFAVGPAVRPAGAIDRHPTGTNVNSQGATTVFISFGNLRNQIPVEAAWCGKLVPATPDIGSRCDPSRLFGQLPLRYDQSQLGANGASFTDIMTIPASVARRAYQAAQNRRSYEFFYVRRFDSTVGGPSEFVFVTCRLAGVGARVPLALLDVRLAFATRAPVLAVERAAVPPPLAAEIAYNGTGRLVGRWEVVLPGDEPPAGRDLLPEASLPPQERLLQRRWTEIERFNLFLPPTGRVTLPGPDPKRLPTQIEGLYQVLLRIEASDDKDADSNLGLAGAGDGIVHSGAASGFPLPVLRYFVGSVPAGLVPGELAQLAPADDAELGPEAALDFSWTLASSVLLYRLEIADANATLLFSVVVQQGIGSYRAPPFVREKAVAGALRWRVVAIGPNDSKLAETGYRILRLAAPANAAANQPPP